MRRRNSASARSASLTFRGETEKAFKYSATGQTRMTGSLKESAGAPLDADQFEGDVLGEDAVGLLVRRL